MRLRLAHLPLLTIAWAMPSFADADHASINQVLATNVIQPLYGKYHDSMQALEPAISTLCTTPNAATLQEAKAAFDASMDGWQRLQPAAFGPIETEGLGMRIHFWPDKHGTAGKQISKLLAKPDPAALENGVAGKSAALQSLATLERVLFDRAELIRSAEGGFACGLALAIADFQGELADQVQDAWASDSGHGPLFASSGGGNAAYYDGTDATTDLFGAIAASLDGIVANKLERPLGTSLEGAKPKRAEDWRSGRSLRNIIANLETIQALYTEQGGLHVFLSAKGQDGLDQVIRKGLDQTIATASSIEMPLAEAVADKKARADVEKLIKEVKSLRILFTSTLADAASLTIGFNQADGD